MHTLKLINSPAGFDAFLMNGETEVSYKGMIALEGQCIRLKRQPQFKGSAELIYEVDGSDRITEETGGADLRDDAVVDMPDTRVAPEGVTLPPIRTWRLQTNCACFPK